MNEKLYRATIGLQDKLAETLALPHVERALKLCEEKAKIRTTIVPIPGVHMDILTAAAYNQALGMQKIIDMLRRLGTKSDLEEYTKEQEDEFEHALPDVFKQARLLNQTH